MRNRFRTCSRLGAARRSEFWTLRPESKPRQGSGESANREPENAGGVAIDITAMMDGTAYSVPRSMGYRSGTPPDVPMGQKELAPRWRRCLLNPTAESATCIGSSTSFV